MGSVAGGNYNGSNADKFVNQSDELSLCVRKSGYIV